MRLTKYLFFALLLGGLAASCGSNASSKSEDQTQAKSPEQAEQAAWDQMMEVHDEVMPKMADLNRTSRELKSIAESTDDKAVKEQINQQVKELEAASEAMMVWMGELQKLSELRENKSHEEIITYLETEKAEIDEVGEEMMKSLEEGQKLLAELQEQQK